MDDVNFKDIRVLPGPPDLKNNAGKTLSEILGQLQSGAILKGLVVGTTAKGEVFFHTAYGRFAAPNILNLERGDTIQIKLSVGDEKIAGTILSINEKKAQIDEPIKLNLVRQASENEQKLLGKTSETPVNIQSSNNIPRSISGQVSYLNLSRIDKNSPLFSALSNASTNSGDKIPISLNVISSSKTAMSAFTADATVSGNTRDGHQLIKTNFGVITTNNTKMLVGQKLAIQITSINNQLLSSNITQNVSDFMYNVNKNWPMLKSLVLTPSTNNVPNPINDQSVNTHIAFGRGSNSANPMSHVFDNQLLSTARGRETPVAQQEIGKASAETSRLPSLQSTVGPKDTTILRSENIASNKNPAPLSQQEARTHAENASRLQTVLPKSGKDISKSSNSSSENNKTSMRSETITRTGDRIASAPIATEKTESHSLNSIIKNLGDHEEIRKLSAEFQSLKELFVPSAKEDDNSGRWQAITVPFYNGHIVEDHEVKIDRSRENFLRFIFDVNLENNPMQVDGLIKFENNNKTPRAFDLILRAKKQISPDLQNRISEIYSLNQNITGVRGTFIIESFDQYVQT